MANPFRAAARLTAPVRGMPRRASTWSGGEGGRLYSDWDAWTFRRRFETRFNFRLLRARARSFARNNPWIVGFLDELANNVVGANGIMLQAMIKTALGKPAKATNDEIERGWKEWRCPENASADGHDSFTELERQIIQTIAIDGECFVRRIRGADTRSATRCRSSTPISSTRRTTSALARIRTGSAWASKSIAGIAPSRIGSGRATPRTWTAGAETRAHPADEMQHLFVRWHRANTRAASRGSRQSSRRCGT
jgi:capsid protein